ncbi:MAG: LPS-assembly protein LptD [Bacteroidales bacterium]|nr:LPS-assembly protein LptD [Bacteroidales bacterium]
MLFTAFTVLSGIANNANDSTAASYGKYTLPFAAEADTVIETFATDSISADSVLADTVPHLKKSAIDAPVNYKSEDSMMFDLTVKKVYLYGQAMVTYEDIELTADYIEFDMANKEVYAVGVTDSLGNERGRPVFKDDGETFEAKSIRYNFDTKRGYIREVYTQQSEGYLHSERTKRQANGEVHLKNGKYTTCDAKHPHFYIGLTKAVVIPDDKIISGPAYMVVQDIPLPLIIPFGWFPNSKQQTSGLLFPTYGEERSRGFFLRNGGWYFAINDYIDAKVTGDVYSYGGWAGALESRYKVRYKFSGSLRGSYYENSFGQPGETQTKSKDFSIGWTHSQDPKANPYQTFSASVNYSSRSYDQNQTFDQSQQLTNTKNSSISFSKRWPNKEYSLQLSTNISQNSRNKTIDLTLPSGSFSSGNFYPFRFGDVSGKPAWYEKININYSAQFQNKINTYDTLLFTPQTTLNDFDKGFRHSIPLSTNIKVLNILIYRHH